MRLTPQQVEAVTHATNRIATAAIAEPAGDHLTREFAEAMKGLSMIQVYGVAISLAAMISHMMYGVPDA